MAKTAARPPSLKDSAQAAIAADRVQKAATPADKIAALEAQLKHACEDADRWRRLFFEEQERFRAAQALLALIGRGAAPTVNIDHHIPF